MYKILEIFKEISQIEHCSFKNSKLKEYIFLKSKEYGYSVKSDNVGNIFAYKDNPKLCLQAHYDMVCVGDAPKIEIIEKNGLLKAKNSSLGADNGIAVAMILYLMSKGEDIEALFTNDEEVGLIGAKNIELDIKSEYILNLDSEDEGMVFIGCAGGADLKISKNFEHKNIDENIYSLEIKGLPGGHSGVDIDKNIPNAILILNSIIKESNAYVSSFKGGVAINAIPASAKAIVKAKKIKKHKNLEIEKINTQVKVYDSSFVDDLSQFKSGVISFNEEFNVVENSANVGLIDFNEGELKLEISLRSLSNENLEKISKNAKEFWESRGYIVKLEDKYPAWKPQENEFTKIVKKSLNKFFIDSKYVVIHAGLECGVLKNKYPKKKFASIGPNIKYPHSKNEQVEIESVFKTFKAVEDIINSI